MGGTLLFPGNRDRIANMKKQIPVKKLLSAKVTCDIDVLMRKNVRREMEAMVSKDFNIHEFCFLFSFRKFVIS